MPILIFLNILFLISYKSSSFSNILYISIPSLIIFIYTGLKIFNLEINNNEKIRKLKELVYIPLFCVVFALIIKLFSTFISINDSFISILFMFLLILTSFFIYLKKENDYVSNIIFLCILFTIKIFIFKTYIDMMEDPATYRHGFKIAYEHKIKLYANLISDIILSIIVSIVFLVSIFFNFHLKYFCVIAMMYLINNIFKYRLDIEYINAKYQDFNIIESGLSFGLYFPIIFIPAIIMLFNIFIKNKDKVFDYYLIILVSISVLLTINKDIYYLFNLTILFLFLIYSLKNKYIKNSFLLVFISVLYVYLNFL